MIYEYRATCWQQVGLFVAPLFQPLLTVEVLLVEETVVGPPVEQHGQHLHALVAGRQVDGRVAQLVDRVQTSAALQQSSGGLGAASQVQRGLAGREGAEEGGYTQHR